MAKSAHKKLKTEFLFQGKEARKQKALQLNKVLQRNKTNATN